MKRLVMTMLTVLTAGSAFALPVGNPSDASLLCNGLFWEGNCCGDPCDPCGSWCDAFSFRFGFYGDYVFERHLKFKAPAALVPVGTHGRVVDHTRINTNAGYLALNICNRFDVFATLGVTRLGLDISGPAILVAAGSRVHLETNSNFSWSVGGRLTLWECGCTALGLEGQYFSWRPNVQRVSGSIAGVALNINPTGQHLRWQEWQVGLGISHRINILVPYVAVKYSRAYTSWSGTPDPVLAALIPAFAPGSRFRSQKHWGYAVGVSLVDCGKMDVTAEGRFADEKALYINAQIRF